MRSSATAPPGHSPQETGWRPDTDAKAPRLENTSAIKTKFREERLTIPAIERDHLDDAVDAGADDEGLCVIGDVQPLLTGCNEVVALCRKVERTHFRLFRRDALVFDFSVVEPPQWAGATLQMFVRTDPRWKNPPPSSKLYKSAWIAAGALRRRQQISSRLFTGKLFRCRLRIVVPQDGPPYSVVDALLEKITG